MSLLLSLRDKLSTYLVDTGETIGQERLYAFLKEKLADKAPHANGRSLLEHLQGTVRILRAWGVPNDVAIAGLFHSVYSTTEYPHEILSPTKRSALRAMIGSKAEGAVFLFSRLDRQALFRTLPSLLDAAAGDAALVPISDGSRVQPVSRENLVHLLSILLANDLDQIGDIVDGPGTCLANWSAVDQLLRAKLGSEAVPWPLFTVPVTIETEQLLLHTYKTAIQHLDQNIAMASELMLACVNLCPWIPDFHIWLVVLYGRARNEEALGYHAREAERLMLKVGTFWDKRLVFTEWLRLMQELCGSDTTSGALQECESLIQSAFVLRPRLVRECNGSGINPSAQPSTIAAYRFSQFVLRNANKIGPDTYPGLRTDVVFDTRHFPLAKALETSFATIRQEIRSLGEDLYVRESERIKRTGDWDVLFFSERGQLNLENCLRCPTIASLMLEHNTVRSSAGLIYVSRLRPKTQIAEHCGPTNVRLRCHLGIDIPDGDAGIRVGDTVLRWEQGKAIVFNDSIVHKAWNNTAEDRTVLIVDLWHPDLQPEEVDLLRAMDVRTQRQAEGLMRYRRANHLSAEARRKGYD